MAEGAAREGDAVGLMEKPVEHRLGQGGVSHGAVPGGDRELAGDERGAELGPVLDDLQAIAALLDGRRGEQEVIQHEERNPLELDEQPLVATVAAADREIVEEPWGS
jgi:hypothetical protein